MRQSFGRKRTRNTASVENLCKNRFWQMSDEQSGGILSPDERNRLLASVVESSDDAILAKDPYGIIQTWNRGAERLYGYKAAEVIGRSAMLLLPAERAGEETEILERIRRGER